MNKFSCMNWPLTTCSQSPMRFDNIPFAGNAFQLAMGKKVCVINVCSSRSRTVRPFVRRTVVQLALIVVAKQSIKCNTPTIFLPPTLHAFSSVASLASTAMIDDAPIGNLISAMTKFVFVFLFCSSAFRSWNRSEIYISLNRLLQPAKKNSSNYFEQSKQ